MKRGLVPLRGDELVEELLRLETEKHNALVGFDSDAYEAGVSAQVRLLSEDHDLTEAAGASVQAVSRLADLIRLNSLLLINLNSISPYFAFAEGGYSSFGGLNQPSVGRVRLEG
jgi:hypothetical protein